MFASLILDPKPEREPLGETIRNIRSSTVGPRARLDVDRSDVPRDKPALSLVWDRERDG